MIISTEIIPFGIVIPCIKAIMPYTKRYTIRSENGIRGN